MELEIGKHTHTNTHTHLLVEKDTCNGFHDGLRTAGFGAALGAAGLWVRHPVLVGKHIVALLPYLLRQPEVGLQPRATAHRQLAKGDNAREKAKVLDALHNVRGLEILLECRVRRRLLRLGASKEANAAVDHGHLAGGGLPLAGGEARPMICATAR